MAVTVVYLDEHGVRTAERVSDILYKSYDIICRWFREKYWFMNYAEDNLMFEIGSDKRGFIKYPEWEKLITFYVRFRGYKRSRWYSPNYPERNTIYISPKENGLPQHKYYSLCYRRAEKKIRVLVRLATGCADRFIPISFSDFIKCFSNAFFVDAFTIERPDFSYFNKAVNKMVTYINKKCSGSEEYNALIFFQVPERLSAIDYGEALEAIDKKINKLKFTYFKVGVGFNGSSDSFSITAAISYRHPEHGTNSINEALSRKNHISHVSN